MKTVAHKVHKEEELEIFKFVVSYKLHEHVHSSKTMLVLIVLI